MRAKAGLRALSHDRRVYGQPFLSAALQWPLSSARAALPAGSVGSRVSVCLPHPGCHRWPRLGRAAVWGLRGPTGVSPAVSCFLLAFSISVLTSGSAYRSLRSNMSSCPGQRGSIGWGVVFPITKRLRVRLPSGHRRRLRVQPPVGDRVGGTRSMFTRISTFLSLCLVPSLSSTRAWP